jgi:osmotically-inducible protein OsmY
MKISQKYFLSLVISALLLLSSCVETVIVGTVAGTAIVTREKTIRDTVSDVKIAAKIDSKLLKNDLKNPVSNVNVMVNEKRVLLTGIIDDADKAKKANEISWSIDEVKEVIDEIDIVSKEETKINLKRVTKTFWDYVITGQIEAKLFFTKGIYSKNYKITSIAGRVYVLGVANDHREIQRLLRAISTTLGVKEVVNHVILINDSRR